MSEGAARLTACDLVDCGDGTYNGSFVVGHVGACVLSISLDGTPIGVPLTVPVQAAPTDAACCSLTVAEECIVAFAGGGAGWAATAASATAASAAASATAVAAVRPRTLGVPSLLGGRAAPPPLPRLTVPVGESVRLMLEARDGAPPTAAILPPCAAALRCCPALLPCAAALRCRPALLP